jgi:hypothetical protein
VLVPWVQSQELASSGVRSFGWSFFLVGCQPRSGPVHPGQLSLQAVAFCPVGVVEVHAWVMAGDCRVHGIARSADVPEVVLLVGFFGFLPAVGLVRLFSDVVGHCLGPRLEANYGLESARRYA